MLNFNELIKKAQSVTNTGLLIMEGRETGEIDDIIDEVVIVDNYQFGEGKEGKYVAFTIKGNDTEFFFGGSVVTDNFTKLNDVLNEEEREQLLEQGLEVTFSKRRSNNKRTYTMCTFFPNN